MTLRFTIARRTARVGVAIALASMACTTASATVALAAVPAGSAGAITVAISYSTGGGPIFTSGVTSAAALTGIYSGTLPDAATGAHFAGTAALTGSGTGFATWDMGFDTYAVSMMGTSPDGTHLQCDPSDLQLYVYREPGGIAIAGLQGSCLIAGTSVAVDTLIVGTWLATNPGAGLVTPETSLLLSGAAGGW
jgi:hypothetical protein